MVATERTLAQIDAEIAATKEALACVKGSETEVYARIVGYYRSVRNWNKGKRNEYDLRKMFVYGDESPAAGVTSYEKMTAAPAVTEAAPVAAKATGSVVAYEFFARKTCPNCPPVKERLAHVSVAGTYVDVDTEAGLNRAAEMGVMAAPTVILYDANGAEVARAHTVAELNEVLPVAQSV